ncbi:MAG: 3-phosphoserine/phosphohydroxythreonine transaminase [Acidovorax defluvii]
MAWNFAAGPARLPDAVLDRAAGEIFQRGADGACALERPFSGPDFRAVLARAKQRLTELLDLPANYQILFLAGGAMQQFSLLPLNLCRPQQRAAYANAGYWSARAMAEASRQADTVEFFPPADGVWAVPADCAYCHITPNETVDGSACASVPDTGAVPLAADCTSSFLTAPLAVEKFGVIYARAQKNIAPAGLTVAIIRDDLLERCPADLPAPFSYRRQAEANSCVNTPPMFAIQMAALVFDWIAEQGGLTAMAAAGQRKAARVYGAIDGSGGVFVAPVAVNQRSPVNIRFQLADPALSEAFISAAAAAGLHHLRGHAHFGGLRASLYNAMPEAGAQALAEFIADFARRHG